MQLQYKTLHVDWVTRKHPSRTTVIKYRPRYVKHQRNTPHIGQKLYTNRIYYFPLNYLLYMQISGIISLAAQLMGHMSHNAGTLIPCALEIFLLTYLLWAWCSLFRLFNFQAWPGLACGLPSPHRPLLLPFYLIYLTTHCNAYRVHVCGVTNI